jgi:integrase/recombinase XerD
MKLQKGHLDNGKIIWLVLDENYLPVDPISKYLKYLDSIERSPNTIESYARNLKMYWEFLTDNSFDWRSITLEKLSEFIHWLRNPQPNVIRLSLQKAKRSEKTINHALTTVTSFYEFHERIEKIKEIEIYSWQRLTKTKYKPFLHHLSKNNLTKTRLLKVREIKTFPGCLTDDEIKTLINGCNRIRDKFLICLLYETGMRIGEALGLRHEDLVTGEQNKIHIVPRRDNFNNARAKCTVERAIYIDKDLMRLYSDYLIEEYPEGVDSDYVFVNIWSPRIVPGTPMLYSAVDDLFRRLHKKTGIKATPHLFRHTHATELIRAGWNIAYVQKRLGHSDIQTTINTYVHLVDDDLKSAYKQYLENRNKS